MARIHVKKSITKGTRVKKEVDGDTCSAHGKKRKAEYLIDDGKGGMCCAPGDECKGSKEAGGKPERQRRGKNVDPDAPCKWCELGECWSHGQIEKPEKKVKERRPKNDVDGDVCSVHGKSRKAEYLIDDGKGGMCCAPGDECKGVKKSQAGKFAQRSAKKAQKGRQGKKDVDGDVCSTHGKKRKAEYLIDDGEGGMCCQPGDECKGGKEGKPERKRRGKNVDSDGCKWCEQGECWSHGQIERPERPAKKARHGKKADVDGDVCSVHGKSRKAEYLIDDGKGGMRCAPGDACKGSKETPAGRPARRGGNVPARKGGSKGGKQMQSSRGGGQWVKTPTPAEVRHAIQVMQMAQMAQGGQRQGKGGKGSRKGGGKGNRRR